MTKSALKPLLLSLLIVFCMLPAAAQSVVNWKATSKMTTKTEGTITITATIDKGWHIYGLEPSDDGPVPTTITIALPAGVTKVGELKAVEKPVKQTDDMFGCEVTYWENKVTFTQKFRIPKKIKKATAKVSVNYMSCNDTSCLPPSTDELTVKLK